MKENHDKIKEEVIRLKEVYGFRGPLHYTDFSNLSSIIRIGYLCSRSLCYANNIEFFDVCHESEGDDFSESIKRYTRFYFVKNTNIDVLCKLNTPVCLLFSEEIVYSDLAAYSDANADFNCSDIGDDYEFFNGKIDWELVFNRRIEEEYFEGHVKEILRRKSQAELLIDEPVSIKYIKNIIFRCRADYKRACGLYGKNKMFIVEPEMFEDDRNYIMDYNIVYNGSVEKDVFILHFCSKKPVKNDGRHEYSLYDMEGRLIRNAKVNFLESKSTDFHVEVSGLSRVPILFKFWFYGILSIEETIG